MPAEWAVHERTLMAWPTARRRDALWGSQLEPARDAYASIARTIARFEPVTLVADPVEATDARRRCGDAVEVVALPIDDAWIRDNGPVVVVAADGSRHAVHFRFNAWGGKFRPFDADARAGAELARRLGLPVHEAPLVLEGGAIAVDGDGTLVTTERCVLNPNRNPGRSPAEVEAELRRWLGARRVVWLPDGIAEDEGTDGHVDNVVAFHAPGRVLLQGCDDAANPNAAIAAENRRRLAGAGVEVVEVPVLPYADVAGRRVPVPYVNLYVVNGGVLVPTVGHPADDDVLAVVASCFPGRDVVAVPGAVLAYGGGGVHCITQQVPA
ncbi:MAG: agmatine deiminase [Acidimicrobiia bacterium]|nr:MAG: agmatine deiminase [Acidimicrobiia bacterium]